MINIDVLLPFIGSDRLRKLNDLLSLLRTKNLFALATGPYPVSHGEDHIGKVIERVGLIVQAIGIDRIPEDPEMSKEDAVFELAAAALIHDIAMGAVAILSENSDLKQRKMHASIELLQKYFDEFGFNAYLSNAQINHIILIAWSHCGDIKENAFEKSQWVDTSFTFKSGHRHLPMCMRILRFADLLDVGPHRLNPVPTEVKWRPDQIAHHKMHQLVTTVICQHWVELQRARLTPESDTHVSIAVKNAILQLKKDLMEQCLGLSPWFKDAWKIFDDLDLDSWVIEADPADENEPITGSLKVNHPCKVCVDNINTTNRLPGEVFMAEMLQKPIVITKEDDTFSIFIDREDVQELVIATKCKKELSEKYIHGELIEHYTTKDKEIHRFLSGFINEPDYSLPLHDNFKLRWASGGVLSVVKFQKRKWIPLFFRDIRPYGWNIALGSSERHFNKDNKVINNLENELTSPSRFIYREFLEETLIIDGDAKEGVNSPFQISLPYTPPMEDANRMNQFETDHIVLRKEYDRMEIQKSKNVIKTHSINANMIINIISPSSLPRKKSSESDVLVCFSLLDLGIEVVKLLSYNLPNNCEILDGEVLDSFDGEKTIKDLIRMPVVLISCEFLYSVFSGDITKKYNYTSGTNPSIEIDKIIPSDQIHIFKWDLIKRLEIVKGIKEGTAFEKKRYTDWYDKFSKNFFDSADNIINDNPSKLFTPATAKLLNLFFRYTSQNVWR